MQDVDFLKKSHFIKSWTFLVVFTQKSHYSSTPWVLMKNLSSPFHRYLSKQVKKKKK